MVYINNIYTDLLVFPFIAALFTLPYAVFQYNKHGAVSKYRTLIIYSFILYMLIAFFMVCLPLPDRASTVGNTWQEHLNLIPFRQIWLYWHDKAFGIAALKKYLVSMSLWQLLFNILLTVPFGMYMRYYFKLSLKRTVLYSFLLSLFYELCISALYIFLIGVIRILNPEFTGFYVYAEVQSWSFFCLISLVQVLITRGSTLGHAVCRVILVSEEGGAASAGQLIKRYLFLWLFTGVPLIIAGLLTNMRFAFVIDVIILALVFISRLYFVMYFINVVLRKGKLMPHDKLSGTLYMVAELPEAPDGDDTVE